MEFLKTRIFTDKALVKVEESFDIPIICEENAIMQLIGDSDYSKVFNLPRIRQGLTIHNDQFYYFEHNILETLRSYGSTCYSYNVYPITADLANRLNRKEKISKWEIDFNSFYHYGEYYVCTGIDGIGLYVDGKFKYTSDSINKSYRYKSYFKDGDLYIPYSVSYAGLDKEAGITIGDILNNKFIYPPLVLDVNLKNSRNFKLSILID